jgi:hypothetical protein
MLSVLLAAALASNGGVAWPDGVDRPETSQCAIDALEKSRSVIGLRVQKAELDRAEKTLGPSPRRTQGDGGEWRAWRCWEAANGDGTVLQVGRTDVNAFIRVYGREMSFAERGRCAKSKLVHRDMATVAGLRLDLASKVVKEVLPAAPTVTANAAVVDCYAKRPAASGSAPVTDIVTLFTVVLVAGKVAAFEIMWTETY